MQRTETHQPMTLQMRKMAESSVCNARNSRKTHIRALIYYRAYQVKSDWNSPVMALIQDGLRIDR